ncbi:ankyrin, putative [Talaromyces stipitatus ATCC 10500]|uniref:Ankyrin, putative n=1 Tax=Talaromyces stipitatus (strain ATCC 10500 / CBS 375.48 / QM 6759 / NRRL 1006) TaxID=441959 RepID=B8ME45_TALSN|nr:ankyrin, putative [Talaromyces stipitatus ATCC 10500]EED16472.1 ankyrin, putative [Talaromyces stipitatus ATCC 10500]
MANLTLSHHDYTVAWVCALPVEMAASETMLDEIHGRLPQVSSDHNTYILGSLNGHNVVIAGLPFGIYGITSATTVLVQMLATFPSLRFGLMVGIGGGVPTKFDIRLGDVVISKPTGNGSVIVDSSEPFGERPNAGKANDQAEHYEHGEHDCSTCDLAQLLLRPPRATDDPDFHYGLIASGNQLMKDAETRDQMGEGRNILCFEMEAAGLMDQLPCLGYAALTAAAYAKQLLSVVPLTYIHSRTGHTKDFTPEEKACLQSLFITDPVEDKNAPKRRKGDRAPGTCDWIIDTDELQTWLASPSASTERVLWLYGYMDTQGLEMDILLDQYDIIGQKNALAYFFCDSSSPERCTATAILRGLLYQLIKQRPHFMKHLLHKFEERKEKLFDSFDALWAVFIDIGCDNTYNQLYCIIDALDECDQNTQKMLFTQITRRLGNQNDGMIGKIHFLITSRPFPEIREYLHPYMSKDLCTYPKVQDDLQVFIDQKLNQLAGRKGYFERTKRDLSRILKEKAEGTFLWVSIVCEKLAGVRSRDAIEKLQSLPQGLHSLYARLLETALDADKDGFNTILRILAVVGTSRRPLSLPELSIACRLYEEEYKEHRLRYLQEDIDMCRLMVVIQDGIVRLLHKSVRDFLFNPKHSFSINALQVHASLANRCVGYLLDNIVLLQRQRDQEEYSFLEYATVYWPEHAGSADMEFTILPEYQQFFCPSSAEREVWLNTYRKHHHVPQHFSILHVAARLALHYAAENGNEILVVQLLTRTPKNLEAKDVYGQPPLLTAVENLHAATIYRLIDAGAHVHTFNNRRQNALHLICKARKSNDSCRLLAYFMDKGVSINEPDASASGMTALHFSALNGSVGMTEFLCLHHANPNAQSETGDTPLHLAIRRRMLGLGYEDYWITGEYAVEELSNFITDWESEEASEIFEEIDTTRVRIVNVLLSMISIDVNIANNQGDCALHVIPFDKWYASEILLQLIEKGADISKSNNKRQTCLHLACEAGNLDAVRILLSRGCSITLQDIHGSTPLHCAVKGNYPDVVRFILEQRPQQLLGSCQQSGFFQTKLLHHHVKSYFCSVETINLLLQHGFGPNELDENGDSVLSLYLRLFHIRFQVEIFDCLVQNGASMTWFSEGREGLIHLVMRQWDGDNFLVLKRLLQCFDIAAKDAKGRNVLHHGAIHGAFNKDLTNLPQETNIFDSLHEKDFQGKTPLDYAEEETQRKRHPNLFKENRWNESLHNLKSLQEGPI